MENLNKSQVGIKVLIPDAIITEHSELLAVYDQQTETITYDVENSIPKEFIEKLELLVPQFHGNDIVLFTPLIEKVNELQAIKQLLYNAEDYDASDRLYIDNNKLIGAFNSTIKEIKSLMKQPQISKNKLLDQIFEIFENEGKNTRGALETNFKPLLDKREEIKNAKETEKKKVELEAISKLNDTNSLLTEQLANQTKATAMTTAENAINSILTNIALKLPNLNKEGLEQLKENVASIHFNMYVSLELQNSFTAEEIGSYTERFKANRAAGVKNIEMAITALDAQSANQVLTNQNAVLQAQVPAPENIADNISNMEVTATMEKGLAINLNDAKLFQFMTDETNRITTEYAKMIESFDAIQFANPQVAELRDKLTKENLPKIQEWNEKISTFCNKKQELVNQHFNI